MSSKAERPFGLGIDPEGLLEKMGEARKTLIAAQSGMRRGSGLYRCMDAVLDEIDELAFVMTGEREYYWRKPHSIGR